MIGQRFNFEDVFFRDLTVCVLDTLEGQVKWINRFSSGDVFVNVPFYYSLSGDERFLLDSFADDIVSENRFIELNTDIVPRGHLTMTGFNIKSDEFANPNVWLRMVVENEVEIRRILSKVRAVPITVNYDLEITLSSEIDTFKCSQAIMDTLWIYKYMYFEHNFMNIDAILLMPDTNSIEMAREKNLTSENAIKLKCSFTVETYYPAFRGDRFSGRGTSPNLKGSGMVDSAGFSQYDGGAADLNEIDIGGGYSGYFAQPGQPGYGSQNSFGSAPGSFAGSPGSGTYQNPSGGGTQPPSQVGPGGVNPPGQTPYGQTGSFYNTQGAGSPNTPFGQFSSEEYFEVLPKRTRWFNNILKYRDSANGITKNENDGKLGGRSNDN